jgi:hypothetical protein
MSAMLDLREIERKAFRSTYQDGLWDMWAGVIVMAMAFFMYRPEAGYSPTNIIVSTITISAAGGLLWAGKRLITVPRMGQVRFGPARKRKGRTLAIILGLVVLVQAGVVGLTAFGWLGPEASAQVNGFLADYGLERLAVATLASLFVGPAMILMAYFSDFPRGYYIAVMMSLAVFLMILTNRPVYPVVIGGLIFLPGLVLFVRFLKRYPLPQEDGSHERHSG